MNESLFVQFISKVFPKLGTLIEKINGKRNANLTYLHKTMLRKEYSADQKWESASVNTNYVTADVVSMDSALPIKKRDSIARANGKLPKIGLKYQLSESQINEINVMIAQGATMEQIAKKLINDSVKCSTAIDERNEANFLSGFSNGVCLVEDENNVGVGLRVNFGYLPENCFGVEEVNHISRESIERVIEKADADGNAPRYMWIALSTFKKMRQENWAKELVANFRGQVYTNPDNLPTPTATAFNEAFADEFGGIEIRTIDRVCISEKNGVRTTYKPWNANKVIFTPSEEVGALVWGTLAEMTNPVEGVVYSTIDEYKLISKFSKTDPLAEYTAGQAMVLPVIEGVDQIYSLDISEAQELDSDAEGIDTADESITVWGNTYTKAAFVEALAKIGVKVSATATDATLIKKVNALSDAEEAQLKALLA